MSDWGWRRAFVWIRRPRGSRARAWAFTLGDIAAARGCSISGVRKAIRSGRLDMHDLASIGRFIARRKGHDAARLPITSKEV